MNSEGVVEDDRSIMIGYDVMLICCYVNRVFKRIESGGMFLFLVCVFV